VAPLFPTDESYLSYPMAFAGYTAAHLLAPRTPFYEIAISVAREIASEVAGEGRQAAARVVQGRC